MPRFSIQMPVYNTEKYVGESIESVLSQTYGDFELLIIDDGSTDSSGAICDGYAKKDPRIKVFHTENRGVFKARGTLIKNTGAGFVVFLDSDDLLEPEALAVIADIIDRTACDMVLYDFSFGSGSDRIPAKPLFCEGRVFTGDEKKEIYRHFISGNLLNNLSTKAVSGIVAVACETYGEEVDISNGDDLVRALSFTRAAGKIVSAARHLYRYRNNPDSLTRSPAPQAFRSVTGAKEYVRSFMIEEGMDGKENRRGFAGSYLNDMFDRCARIYRSSLEEDEKLALYAEITSQSLFCEVWETFPHGGVPLRRRLALHLLTHKKHAMLKLLFKLFYKIK